MYRELNDLIDGSYSIRDSVKDVDALLRLTQKMDAFKMRWSDWGKIKTLYFLGSSDFREIDELRDSKLQPGYYLDKRTGGWLLVIGASAQRIQEHLSRCGENLQKLTIHFTSIERIDLSYMTGIEELNLSRNEKLCRIIGMDKLTELRILYLHSTRIGPTLDLNPYFQLALVNISGTPVQDIHLDHSLERLSLFYANQSALRDVSFISWFPQLESLALRDVCITQLPSLDQHKRLEHLSLDRTKLQSLPQLEKVTTLQDLWLSNIPIESLDQIRFPENLVWIDLGELSRLKRIPSGIRYLKKLKRLRLTNLRLDTLPDWFPELLQQDIELALHGTKVRGMEAGFLQQPKEMILQWFAEQQKEKINNVGSPLNEVKIVFLGDGEAGKSHCIARLLKDGEVLTPEETPNDSTPGVVITDKSYRIGDRDVQVHFWDFGGQEILHSMHRMFLTERTLYVILINARDDTQDDRARYWLHNVKSFAGTAPVLLVLNKMDQNPNASVNETDLRSIYPGLTEVVKLSAMFDNRVKFNAAFTEAMKRQIGNMENLGYFFPASWTRAKQRLLGMTENYIRGSDYAAICDESGVTDEGDLRRSLLNWFNDLGVSICYSKNIRLRDYVILRPNWITNAVYAILFNKHPDTRNGIISHDAIFEMIQPPGAGADPYRRANPAEVYTQAEIDYILGVTRKFRLSFQVDAEREFIPMLCGRDSLPIAAEYAADPDALEFRMTFDYLPSNVLHRLMVELRQELDTGHVWRTGARFIQKSSGLSAVVKSEGNVLRIFVRGTKPPHRSNTYLCILKDAIDHIVKDMNLTEPVNEVVYKLDGKRQAFDYDELVESLEQGETTRYSKVHKYRLRIEDILNQTGHRAAAERQKLLQDVYEACQQMQSQKIYWNLPKEELRSKEDIRNDCIRNALRGQRYIVSDQSRNGISPGGSQAGRLDMDIRLEPNVPWTIYEALNIRNAAKSDMNRWDAHLDKLLGPYNPNGLPFLFLVSYVDCSKDDFAGIWSDYFEHLRFHSAGAYELRSAAQLSLGTERYDQNHYLQAAKSIYDRGGFPTTVYHIFVRLGA